MASDALGESVAPAADTTLQCVVANTGALAVKNTLDSLLVGIESS